MVHVSGVAVRREHRYRGGSGADRDESERGKDFADRARIDDGFGAGSDIFAVVRNPYLQESVVLKL